MKFGSVCSGIEAATVAWHGLGWRASWLAEIDKFASAVLAHHYPSVPNLGDMTKIARAILQGDVLAPDVLCGGTPCQAFSVAGLRESLADARGNLTLKFVEIANAIDHVRAGRGEDECIVFWENVPGVLSTKDNAFGCFLAGLAGEDEPLVPPGQTPKSGQPWKWANAGAVYGPRRSVAWRTLDAQYFGVAQRRRRVFVVASARKGFDPAQVLFEWDGVRRDTAPSREARQTAPTIPARSTAGGGLGTDFDCDGELIAGTLQASGKAAGSATQQDAESGLLLPVAYGGNNQSGPIDVATARNACASASASGRMDFETETFLVQPIHCRDVAQTITSNYGKQVDSSDTALGPNIVAFDTTQVTSASNRSNPKHGDPCHPLAAGAHAPAIAFQDRHRGDDGRGYDRAPPVSIEQVGTLETVKPWNVVAPIAFPANLSGTQCASTEELAPSMGATNPTAVAHVQVMPTMTAGGPADTSHNQVSGQMRDAYMVPTTAMQVRRLTPEECEALQGFPRGYTAIPWRGKPAEQCPDGPRYKALGNSWAVPNVAWIGRRIHTALHKT